MSKENETTKEKTSGKWRHYLFEFIILFFAVTLSFFVENQRENLNDQARERKLMAALVEEIKADTMRINEIITLRSQRIQKNDSLIILINSKDLQKHILKVYHYAMNAATRRTLYYETNIMQSLRTGGFDKLTNAEAAKEIRLYYIATQDLLATQENGDVFGGQEHNELIRRVLDANIAHQLRSGTGKLSTSDVKLFTTDPATLNEFCYTVSYLNATFYLQILRLEKMKKQARELLKTIPKEYDLN